jgi:hypothetical protein
MRLPILALLLCVCPALAQDTTQDKKILTDGCPVGTDFEAAGYSIRSVRVENPFEFLPWIAAAVGNARSQVSHLQGAPYKNGDVKKAEDTVSNIVFLPAPPDLRVAVDLMVTSVEKCSGKQLDLTFWILSSQITPVLSGTLESGTKEKSSPQTSSGADAKTNKLKIFPAAGYNRTDRFYAGGSAQYDMVTGRFPFGKFRIDGLGSTSMHNIDATLAGSHDAALGWLAHAQWDLNYHSNSEPAVNSQLAQNRLAAQFSAVSRTPILLRFGTSLEGGNLQSTVPQGIPVAPETVTSSGYGSLKFFLGTTGRWQKTDNVSLGKAVPFSTFSASYGVELGSTESGSSLSWIKHIADFADDLTLPFGDHRWVDLETRLTTGFIQVRSVVPQAARFFGGNRLTPFISGNDWMISSNPFIRSIPANRLATTTDGFGGTSFISFNSTLSLITWRFPLVPAEVTNDKDFPQQMQDAFTTSESLLDVGYQTSNQHYQAMVSNLPKVQSALANLKSAVTNAQKTATPETADIFKECLRPIGFATVRTKDAQTHKGQVQYGEVSDLLQDEPNKPPDPKAKTNLLNNIHEACVNQLNAQVKDATIARAASELDALHSTMETEFHAIDRTASHDRAKAEMTYPKATLNTLLYQVNLFSLSPVLVFDVAHLGPATATLGTRYAAGGGVRLDLVSHVEFTLGYALNPKRLPNEGKGALFFSMGLKNLF